MTSLTSQRVPLRGFYCAFLLFVTIAPISAARAQDLDNVAIVGRVLDQNAAVIPGATVAADLVKTGASRTTVTDAEGYYRIIQLEPGIYNVRASFGGFAPQEKPNLLFGAGQTVRLDFYLFPRGVIVDPVLVTGTDAPQVDTTRTVVGGTVTTQEVESLPVATRSPLDLLFALPGVTEEPLSTRDLAEDRNQSPNGTPEEAGTFSLSGGPAYSNNITIDGLDNNDDRAARERFQPSIEAVDEVQVITNQFSAEYGRASGGRINIRTRGGGKQFRGRGFYFFRDESLNANTFRNNSLGLKRLPLQEHNLGFTFGGPVIFPRYRNHDRTFFFISHEFDKLLDSALIDTLVPVNQSALFRLPAPSSLQGRRFEDAKAPAVNAEIAPFVSSIGTPLENHVVTSRIDHQFNQTHNGAFLYQLGRLRDLRQFGGGNRLADALQATTRNSDALSYSDNFVFSASLVNQARVQLSLLTPAVKARGVAGPVVLITINDPLEAADVASRSGTLTAGSSTTGATDRSESRFQAQDILAYIKGMHSLKFGFDVQRIRSTFIDLSEASGTFNFANAGDFLAAVPNRFRQNFLTAATQRNTYLGFFVQDEWRRFANLLVTYGTRYETESIIRDRNNFGPRVSLAYDPLKSGKTVIRFGAGIFFNRALLRTIDDFTLGAQRLFFDTNTLRDPLTSRLLNADERRAFIAANLRFPQTLSVDSPLVSQFGVLNAGFSRRLDPALRTPESYQANLGMERDLGGGLVFEANYTLNRGQHLWREFNANAARLPAGYNSFTEYLASRDFPNFRSGPQSLRPLYNGANAGELVRFIFGPADPTNANAVGRITEFGVPLSLVNLNSFTSSTSVDVALAALNGLRPDPARAEVEQLISVGNSLYQGLTLEFRKRFDPGKSVSFSFRAAYTLSRLTDDGIVNTSDALTPGDFRAERAPSLLDRRHRFVFSGTFGVPRYLGKLIFSPIWRVASGAPFNISMAGADRNLDDVGNDRPIFTGDTKLLHWRRPDEAISATVLNLFRLPTIGQSGNLPRNAGSGPGFFLLDLNITREFRISEKLRLRPTIELDNLLNKTVFSFGTQFINFSAFAPSATPEQRQAFLDSFLVATRTLRPRQIRLGVRLDF